MEVTLIEWISDDQVLTVFDRDLSLSQLLNEAGVEADSVGGAYVTRIWNSLFAHGVDLLAEYRDFYADDYRTFEDFLYWKYDLRPKLIRRLREHWSDRKTVALCKAGIGGGWSFNYWLQQDEGWPLLERLVNAVRGVEDEDPQ